MVIYQKLCKLRSTEKKKTFRPETFDIFNIKKSKAKIDINKFKFIHT